jgi:single-stranded DNA-binding protein
MNYLNKIEIAGRVGVVNFYEKQTGSALRLSVATRHQVTTGQSEVIEITTWHNVALFGDQAKAMKDKVLKGQWVKVSGPLSKRKYQGKIYDQIQPDSIEILPN